MVRDLGEKTFIEMIILLLYECSSRSGKKEFAAHSFHHSAGAHQKPARCGHAQLLDLGEVKQREKACHV